MTRFQHWRKRALLGVVVFLVLAQLVRPAPTNPPVTQEIAAPADVLALLRRACGDCHSHATRWPWYTHVAPVSWLVVYDVNHGRKQLDLSTWDAYPAKKQAKRLADIAEQVREREMPLWYYLPLHPDARLTDAERARIADWAESASAAGK